MLIVKIYIVLHLMMGSAFGRRKRRSNVVASQDNT